VGVCPTSIVWYSELVLGSRVLPCW
jgi:hypothetical protein